MELARRCADDDDDLARMSPFVCLFVFHYIVATVKHLVPDSFPSVASIPSSFTSTGTCLLLEESSSSYPNSFEFYVPMINYWCWKWPCAEFLMYIYIYICISYRG